MTRRIAIVGCRPAQPGSTGWDLWVAIAADVDVFVSTLPAEVVVVSGGARGVDSRAARAKALGRVVVEHRPDYERYGKRAPLERNRLIVADADEVHAWTPPAPPPVTP